MVVRLADGVDALVGCLLKKTARATPRTIPGVNFEPHPKGVITEVVWFFGGGY